MSDYESSYEEYKQALLRSVHFRDKLREKYANTLYAERNYIDNNGVLAKIGILSAAFGSFIIMCWLDIHFAIRIVAAVIATVCFFAALHIGKQFKEDSGKSSFHSFQYGKCIEDRVQADKEAEARCLVRDMLDRQIDRDEFHKRYEDLSRYDRFAESLKNDYSFKIEIKKHF